MTELDGIEREIESLQRTFDEMNRRLEYLTRIIETAFERLIRVLEEIADK